MNTLRISNLIFTKTSYNGTYCWQYRHTINDDAALFLVFAKLANSFRLDLVDVNTSTIYASNFCTFDLTTESHQKQLDDNYEEILKSLNFRLKRMYEVYKIYTHLDKMLPERILL